MTSQLSRSELVKALSEKEYPTSGELDALLLSIGGAEALEELIDLLQHQPDPANQLPFGFRAAIIHLLGEIGDARALVPLLQCYELYSAITTLTIRTLEEHGVTIPKRVTWDRVLELYKAAGKPSPRQSAAFAAFEKRIVGTHMESQLASQEYLTRLEVFGWRVKLDVARALAKLTVEGVSDVLAHLLIQERDEIAHKHLALTLGRLHDPRAIEALGEYLVEFTSATSYLKSEPMQVIEYLAAYPDERAKELLLQFCERCTGEGKREYRNRAAVAIGLQPLPEPAPPPATSPVSKSACFIATAAYGSDAMPEVQLLRRFRDTRLAPRRTGRTLVALYERLSPPLAAFIRERPAWRRLVRILLLDLVVRILQRAHLVEGAALPARAVTGVAADAVRPHARRGAWHLH